MANQLNFSSKFSRLIPEQPWVKQKGAALILMAFILGLAAAVFVLKTYNSDSAKAEQDEKTYKALNEAKQALIAWAVNHPNTPGLMPYPDRNGDGNYDDTSDCYASNVNFSPSFTIGRLPLFKSDPNCVNAKSTVATALTDDIRDGTGERLWYEVSKNLLHDYKNNGNPAGTSPIINPSIVNSPSNPWFVVRDRNGTVISNRVAAVIIAPGAPIGNQDRSSGIAGANQFIDKIVMADGTAYTNYTYQDYPAITPIQDFIVADDLRVVSKSDPTYKNQSVEPYYYNDKLVYITIDELMAALEKRVAVEVKDAVKKYKISTGFFPYASILGGYKNYSSVTGKLTGALPVVPSHISSCSYVGISTISSTSTCSFLDVNSVVFTKTSTNFTASNNSCQFSAKSCTCTGAGSCTRGVSQFTCDVAGLCSANTAGSYTFNGGSFDVVNNKCTTTCGSDIACSGIGTGNFTHSSCSDNPFNAVATNSQLPAWFMANSWQDYIYYAIQRGASPSLTVGTKTGIIALLITTGYPIITPPYVLSKGSSQSTLSCSLNDYLDSVENTNGDNIYDATNIQRTGSYNDQVLIMSP